MTKAEIKKMETERKYDFINRVYNTILNSIPLETRGHRLKSGLFIRIITDMCVFILMDRIWLFRFLEMVILPSK